MYSLKLILFYFNSFISCFRSYPIDFCQVSIYTSFPLTIEALLSRRAKTAFDLYSLILSISAIVFYFSFQCLCSNRCSSEKFSLETGNLYLKFFIISISCFFVWNMLRVSDIQDSSFSLFDIQNGRIIINPINSILTLPLQYQLMSLNRLLFCLLFAGIVFLANVTAKVEEIADEDEDAFIYRDFPKLAEKGEKQIEVVLERQFESTENGGPTSKIEDFQFVQKEVDELIGIHKEMVDEKGHYVHPANMSNLKRILRNNKVWARSKTKADPEFFSRHQSYQKPTYLWIGCSDSRLPANQILGLDYGEVFVLRNVANMVSPSDISSLAVIQYAVQVLQVKDIIVAGHYGCGGIKAAVTKYDHGPLQAWLSKLRRIRHKHAHAFAHLNTVDEKAKLLVEINVKQQVFNVASTTFVQKAWKDGKQLNIHGLVYDIQTGRLVDLHLTMHCIEQLPEELAIIE